MPSMHDAPHIVNMHTAETDNARKHKAFVGKEPQIAAARTDRLKQSQKDRKPKENAQKGKHVAKNFKDIASKVNASLDSESKACE